MLAETTSQRSLHINILEFIVQQWFSFKFGLKARLLVFNKIRCASLLIFHILLNLLRNILLNLLYEVRYIKKENQVNFDLFDMSISTKYHMLGYGA